MTSCWECGIRMAATKKRCPTCGHALCEACRPYHEDACERHEDAEERRAERLFTQESDAGWSTNCTRSAPAADEESEGGLFE